ncbi:MAG: zinc ribbon domain-containing protein [Pyrinomonadaceae bacterium]
MFCSKCGNQPNDGERFCRICGSDFENVLPASAKENFLKKRRVSERLAKASSKDPDELTANGIGSVFVGDGFLMVAVILSVTHTSISSLLWLLLLIPAFFFFGKGFADVLHARQIYRRLKQNELDAVPATSELPPPRASVVDAFKNYSSGGLIAAPGVTERTTRHLE